MQRLDIHSLNPNNSFRTKPEEFLLEHCGNLVKVGGGNLEERILFFMRRLMKFGAVIPPMDLQKFPRELHTPEMKKMCDFSKSKRAA